MKLSTVAAACSFIVAYVLVLAFLLVAVQRPAPRPQNHYSQVVDLTDPTPAKRRSEARSGTRIISPAALIPGTGAQRRFQLNG